ncbi:MAG TPA: ABC transporter permease [Baekduia sp.]|uniref:ABC transporter permease n=1 Tax=Baekduia sp. TaxID=2600305 RepID=UPI002BC9E9E2|nr:ABC transporter permease [Baekduia sp.]HMJ36304.1 ABC transporter permease [Baekduia sp.]
MTTSPTAQHVARRLTQNAGRYGAVLLRTYGIVLAFLVLVAVVAASSPEFATRTNIFNLFSQWAPAGIMAVAMTFVILAGGFDLSIASGFSLCAVTAAGVGRTEDPAVAFLAALGVGLAIGLVNGVLVEGARINPFITTVGTGFILNGIALVVTGNIAYVVDDPDFGTVGAGRWHGFPYSGMILIFSLVAGGLVLARTVYGQSIYAVGGNAEASRLSGIRVSTTVGSTYVWSGLSMGVAGIIAASQLNSAQANINPNIVFDVITIVVVGGTSLGGGIGAMWRTAVGLGIIAIISNAFSLANINPYYQDIVKGCIIVGALALDVYARRLAGRARTRPRAAAAPAHPDAPPGGGDRG